MKRILIALLLVPFFASAQKASKGFTINATITGLAEGSIVKITRTNDTNAIATAKSTGGKFILNGSLPEPGLFWLKMGKEQPQHIYLENSKITITGNRADLRKMKVTGSKSHDDFVIFQQIFNPLVGDLNGTSARLNMGAKPEEYDSLIKRYQDVNISIQKEIDAFITKRPASFVSPFLLFVTAEMIDDVTKLESRYEKLSESIRNSEIGQSMKNYIVYHKVGAVGTEAIDFIQPDTLGTPVSLSSFRGKYVLVDFWASWCGPCRHENPNVVANYNKFREKNFTVLGVSLDRPGQKEKWMKAIADDQLKWTQVSDLKWWENSAAQAYRISSIPYNFLVDPNGRIIAKNLRGPDLETKLCEVLGCN